MFTTTDLDLAAYLIAKGFSLQRTRPPEPDEELLHFVFSDSEDLRQAVSDWNNRYFEPITADAAELLDARERLYRRVREVRG